MLNGTLTVVNVAYPFAAVSPDAVGGAEQVASSLDRALVRAGHRSIVIGHSSSRVEGELLGVDVPNTTITQAVRERVSAEYRRRLSALSRDTQVDVLHFHGVDCADYLPKPADHPKILVTLHLAKDSYPTSLFAAEARGAGATSTHSSSTRGLFFTCVSEAQRRAFEGVLREPLLIENGVDLEHYRPAALPKADYALCLGRICPEKGFDLALRAAERAGVPLRLAGQVFPYPEHERYFEEQIRPRLDRTRVFLGPVGGEDKRRLLENAACLLVPSQVDETSSLVTMEALASGTPVLVSDRGALPTLIEHGVTGFAAGSEGDFVDALKRVGTLDRRACRASAEARFALERSTASYLALYARLGR